MDSWNIKLIVKLSKRLIMTIKDAKINFIVEKAIKVFLERSISEVTIHDIAVSAGVGEATIYRYFATKQNLVCAVATELEKIIFKTYFDFSRAKSGFEKLSLFYHSYLEIFTSRREFFKFINEFDAFMISEGKTDNAEYSSGLDMFKELCTGAYNEGLKDGSVKHFDDFETFYYATTHALLELCKKLSAADIVKQDMGINKQKEIETLTELILYKLENKSD
ncbi:MAG: TetR/AcrR family transcriptional regulator; helix-turn-helix transcriptional regulator [Clostridia bacterium]|nr:TetR/AcrR family transcriptional regulator; helix-turn-helix transcriptional regulator [Clostridia bacterium]